jgi:hypothetical protein
MLYDVDMKQSYCGLCETCLIDKPDFLDAIAKVKGYQGFSFSEFRKGLDWFLSEPECRGCKGGGGLKECPVQSCAKTRQVALCRECPDLETCEHYNIIIQESPGNIVY